jgi:hypothetical protein
MHVLATAGGCPFTSRLSLVTPVTCRIYRRENFEAALIPKPLFSIEKLVNGVEPSLRRRFGNATCKICPTRSWLRGRFPTPPWATRALIEHVLEDKSRLRRLICLARVDGFDQDKAESKRDERAIILRRLLTSKCDMLEARLSLPTACSMRARAL